MSVKHLLYHHAERVGLLTRFCPKFDLLTQFKDLQGQSEEARAGRVRVILTRRGADLIRRRQEEQEGNLLPELHHFLAIDTEVLCLDTQRQMISEEALQV